MLTGIFSSLVYKSSHLIQILNVSEYTSWMAPSGHMWSHLFVHNIQIVYLMKFYSHFAQHVQAEEG